MTLNGKLDTRFSDATEPVDWARVNDALAAAELYWFTSVREDGRPHVAPMVGVWVDLDGTPAFVFCTGPGEQKARNIAGRAAPVAVTTGVNTWKAGMDVVVEGTAERVTGRDTLTAVADAYRAKYGDDWDFPNDDEVFNPGEGAAYVYRVAADKIIAFAKSPHGQTTFTT